MAKRITTNDEIEIYHEPEIHDIAGTYRGGCICVGGGKNMWEDFSKAQAMFPGYDTMAVNIAGMFLPHPLTHWFSWHAKQLSFLKAWRMAEIPDDKSITHSVREMSNVNYVWNFNGNSSMSGLTVIELAYLLGYRHIILAGIPMDNSGYFYQKKFNPCLWDKDRRREVREVGQRVKNCVQSMSGFTKEIYGEPKI